MSHLSRADVNTIPHLKSVSKWGMKNLENVHLLIGGAQVIFHTKLIEM